MTKAQELMQKIDMLRDELSKPDGYINTRRQAEVGFGTDSAAYKAAASVIKKYEEEIERLLRQYWDLMDETAESARKEADHMAQATVDRDVDGIKLLKELGYKGQSENVIEALCELKQEGFSLTKADVDVLEETIHLVREHLKKAGFDLPFLDDCAAAATGTIKQISETLEKLAVKEYETEIDRDHRPYDVKFQSCRICQQRVMTAIKYPNGWSPTGDKLTHDKKCPLYKK